MTPLPHLVHVFAAFDTGGPQVRTALIINASDIAFRHTIVALSGDFAGRSHLQHENRVRLISAQPRSFSPTYPFTLAKLLRELQPDLLLSYGWGSTDAMLAARLAGLARIIHHEDGFLPEETTAQLPRRLWMRRVLFQLPARLVCPSRTLVAIAVDRWGLPPSRIEFIPNGVDCDRFSSSTSQARLSARRQIGCNGHETVIGCVGQLRPEKNHERLLRGFASAANGANRDTRLLIVGSGPLQESLRRQAMQLGIADRTLFTGLVPDPVAMYRAMDLFALSSDTEQMPIALLEAMSRGLPVVSTDVGDVRMMVSASNRPFVVPRTHDGDFAAALSHLIHNPHAREQLGQANRRECLGRYRLSDMIQAYLNLYEQALRANRS